MIRAIKTLAIIVISAFCASSAHAQEGRFAGNVAIISDYVSSGVSQTGNRPAFQLAATAQFDHFHLGAVGSSVHFGPGATEFQSIDVLAGYRHEFTSGLLIDIGYEHYIVDMTDRCCGAIYAAARSYFADRFMVEGALKLELRARDLDTRLGAAVYLSETVGLRAAVGRSEVYAHSYANLGADYALLDGLKTSVDYHSATSHWSRNKWVMGLNFSF